MTSLKPKLALVIGSFSSVEEIDQYQLIKDEYDIHVISSESICEYLSQASYFQDLVCIALPDYNENPSYLPGLEKVLASYDIVVVKGRLGMYAYQAVKAKWQYQFKFYLWIDNLKPFPAEDVDQMRSIREEVCNAADGYIVQTKSASVVLSLEGVDENLIVKIPPFVEKRIERTKKSKAKALESLRYPEGSIVIGYMGQLEFEEGLSDLIYGIKLVCTENGNLNNRIKLLISGVGSYSDECHQLIKKLNLEDKVGYLEPSRKANELLLAASDAVYIGSFPSRDRIEGDPYRILTFMNNGVPLIACRSALVEELCGKHRIDYCCNSPASIAYAIQKLTSSIALRKDIVKKNINFVDKYHNRALVQNTMLEAFLKLREFESITDSQDLDQQIKDIEELVKKKEYIAAVNNIESVFKLSNLPVHHKGNLHRLVGDSFAKLGDYDAAKAAYIKASEFDPYSAKIFIGMGTLGLIRGNNDVAVLHFQKAVSLAPGDEMANLGLGLGFQGMKEYKEAISWVLKALESNPDSTAAIFTLVQLAYEVDQFDDVERVVRNYLSKNPSDSNMVFTLGGVLYKQGRYHEVVALMGRILDSDEENTNAQGLLKKAREEMEKADISSNNG